MPTSLENVRSKLLTRVSVVNGAFDRWLVCRSGKTRVDRFALQEGFISQLWQAWGIFCRQTVIYSAQGCNTASGMLTNSPHIELSEGEIAYVVKQIIAGKGFLPGKALPMHLEPTWGDTSKLAIVASSLGTSNRATLQSGFASAVTLRDLQACRNAGAHITRDRIGDIRKIAIRYKSNHFQHPSDMMFWEDPVTQNFLWRTWIDEIEFASFEVIQ
jgi:hypothetical protein